MHFRKSILILSLIGLIFLSSSAIALQSGDFTYTLSGSDNDTTPTTSHALTEVWILTAMSGYPTSNLWIGVSTDGLTFQNIKSDGTCAYTGNNGYGVEDPRIMYYTYGGNSAAYYLVYHQRSTHLNYASILIATSTDLINWTDIVTLQTGLSVNDTPNVPVWLVDDSGLVHIITSVNQINYYDRHANSVDPSTWSTVENWSFPVTLKSSGNTAVSGEDASFVYHNGTYYMLYSTNLNNPVGPYYNTSSSLLTGWSTGTIQNLISQFPSPITGQAEQWGIQYTSDGTPRVYWSDKHNIYFSDGISLISWGEPTAINYSNFTWPSSNTYKWGTALRVTDPTALAYIKAHYLPTTTTTTINGRPCPAKKVLGDDNPNLENLRNFRDNKLAQTAIGQKVIQIYYNNADSINAALDRSPALKAVARRALELIAPMLGRKEE